MNILRVKIHDKIKDDSIEFKSLLDDKKQGSFLMQNLNAFDVLGNKREEIDINREMEISLEDFKILHFNNVLVSNGGGYLPITN